jgi:hypothetical protein
VMPAFASCSNNERKAKPIAIAPSAMITTIRAAYDAAMRVCSELKIIL